eukprot:scaffold19216_cov97-Isochrysis_galbana.AAC.4
MYQRRETHARTPWPPRTTVGHREKCVAARGLIRKCRVHVARSTRPGISRSSALTHGSRSGRCGMPYTVTGVSAAAHTRQEEEEERWGPKEREEGNNNSRGKRAGPPQRRTGISPRQQSGVRGDKPPPTVRGKGR